MEKPDPKSQLPEYVHQYITPRAFFGEEDASIEWEDPEKSANIFFHTQSYENFKNENCLYLFGRRGTMHNSYKASAYQGTLGDVLDILIWTKRGDTLKTITFIHARELPISF